MWKNTVQFNFWIYGSQIQHNLCGHQIDSLSHTGEKVCHPILN